MLTPLVQIQSMRHGVRILQYVDISQHDWHGGQILIRRSTMVPAVHRYTVFLSTSQLVAKT